MNTRLDISDQSIRTVKNKIKESGLTGVIADDMRGKHKNRPFRYPEEMKIKVMEHISRFPVIESHYCRESSQRHYLEQGLSVAKMYELYKEDFNLAFYQPKKDR